MHVCCVIAAPVVYSVMSLFVFVCIVLSGEDIEHHHCSIVMAEEGESKVRLLPHEGKCFINHMEADQDTDLSHGESVRERGRGGRGRASVRGYKCRGGSSVNNGEGP